MKTKRSVREALLALAVLGVLGFGIVGCDNGSTDVDNTGGHVHEWDEWTVKTPASILAAGEEQRICKLDASHTDERAIARLTSLIETVEVLGGSFMYGRNGTTIHEDDTLTPVSTFNMGKHPVTQGQWKAVMEENPSVFDGTNKRDFVNGGYIAATPTFNRDNLPVEAVSWYDVLVFANKLSEQDGLQPAYKIKESTDPAVWGAVPETNNDAAWDAVEVVTGANGWRLPSEYQWEFAAKGGRNLKDYTGTEADTYFLYSGSNLDELGDFAVHYENSEGRTHEVGERKPNELGLYDMSGNVLEWCFEMRDETSANRVIRGGSWFNSAPTARSANRGSERPFIRYSNIGFRLVRP